MIRAGLLLLAALALTGARSRDPFAGRVPGKPVDCIHLNQSEGLVIADEHSLLYLDGPRLWRTEPIGHCTRLHPLDTLIIEVEGGQLCRGDRFRVLETGSAIPSGLCLFGQFTPYYSAAPR